MYFIIIQLYMASHDTYNLQFNTVFWITFSQHNLSIKFKNNDVKYYDQIQSFVMVNFTISLWT